MPKQEHNPLQDHMQWNEYVQREIKDQSKENVRGKQYQTFLDKEDIPTQGNILISGSFNNKLPETNSKTVPLLSSSTYGSHAEIEKTSREHVRVESVYKGFYRPRGTGIPFGGTQNSYVEEGDGH